MMMTLCGEGGPNSPDAAGDITLRWREKTKTRPGSERCAIPQPIFSAIVYLGVFKTAFDGGVDGGTKPSGAQIVPSLTDGAVTAS